MSGAGRRIAVLVVLPPRALLLDIAGPLEVLRIADAVQNRAGFAVTYAAPQRLTHSSIGLDLGGAGPLPEAIANGTVVLLPGSATRSLGSNRIPRPTPPRRPRSSRGCAVPSGRATSS